MWRRQLGVAVTTSASRSTFVNRTAYRRRLRWAAR